MPCFSRTLLFIFLHNLPFIIKYPLPLLFLYFNRIFFIKHTVANKKVYVFVGEKRILKEPLCQNFSIPSNIIYYFTKFPSSSKGFQKLIQTCAYFYSQNSLIALNWLRFYNDKWYYAEGMILKPFNIKKLSCKLWLSNFLLVKSEGKNDVLKKLLLKLHRCELLQMTISNQNITFEEYKFLTELDTINNACLNNFVIYGNNNEIVTFDRIIHRLPAIQDLSCTFEKDPHLHFTFETAFIMTKLQRFRHLTHFSIVGLPATINLTNLCSFIMRNSAHYRINFFPTVAEEFKNEFKKMVKKNSFVCKKSASFIPSFLIYRPKVER